MKMMMMMMMITIMIVIMFIIMITVMMIRKRAKFPNLLTSSLPSSSS